MNPFCPFLCQWLSFFSIAFSIWQSFLWLYSEFARTIGLDKEEMKKCKIKSVTTCATYEIVKIKVSNDHSRVYHFSSFSYFILHEYWIHMNTYNNIVFEIFNLFLSLIHSFAIIQYYRRAHAGTVHFLPNSQPWLKRYKWRITYTKHTIHMMQNENEC